MNAIRITRPPDNGGRVCAQMVCRIDDALNMMCTAASLCQRLSMRYWLSASGYCANTVTMLSASTILKSNACSKKTLEIDWPAFNLNRTVGKV